MNKTLQELANTAPGTFFSGTFQANVSGCKAVSTKTGKTFYKANLSGDGVEVSATSFSRDLSPLEGKLVKFGGMGIKRGDDYQGKGQVVLGDKSIISPVGEAIPTMPAPLPAFAGIPTPSAASNRIEGVTVGMAINKAVDILIPSGVHIDENSVWQTASMLIRVAQKLQSGNLATPEATEDSVDIDQGPF
jgi:hypothetical protein